MDEESTSCNGVGAPIWEVPYHLWLKFGGGEFTYVVLYGHQASIQAAVDFCQQRWLEDYWCGFWFGSLYYDVWGAYVVGDEWDIAQLEEHIDRFELGPPEWWEDRPYPAMYWENFGHFLQLAKDEHPVEAINQAAWLVTVHATMRYMAWASEGIMTVEEEELAFAEKLYVHALVCAQAWHGYEAMWPILTESGIVPWPCSVEDTPTFVYWMNDVIDRYFQVTVTAQPTTWGTVKNIFREPGGSHRE